GFPKQSIDCHAKIPQGTARRISQASFKRALGAKTDRCLSLICSRIFPFRTSASAAHQELQPNPCGLCILRHARCAEAWGLVFPRWSAAKPPSALVAKANESEIMKSRIGPSISCRHENCDL